MTAFVLTLLLTLAMVLVVVAAGPAAAPGLSADWRLADSEAQGWGAR